MSTYHSRPPAPAHPALDFLRKVEVWQESPGGTAGLAVAMPEGEERTLAGLLSEFRTRGATASLEAQARYWLVGYREANPPLTAGQEAELDDVIHGSIAARQHREQHWRPSRTMQRVIVAAIVGALALAAGIATRAALGGNGEQGSPPAAGAPVNPAPAPAQGGATDLQRFRADWNVPAVAIGSAGNPAGLVLLQDGLYYPAPWGIPAGDAGWQLGDLTGSVTADVHGDQADVTDSNGTPYTVAVGQPFVISANPQVVFRILRNAIVQSMPQPHAIAVRVPVTTKEG
jgi:hypothetical protein